jgi:hypothetical protein
MLDHNINNILVFEYILSIKKAYFSDLIEEIKLHHYFVRSFQNEFF